MYGKSRKYYEKGTEKYNRKQFLKFEIKKFEEDHEEYHNLKNHIAHKTAISELDQCPYDI